MSTPPILLFLVLATAVLTPLNATNPIDTTSPSATLDDQFKCGGCPCSQPCYTAPPPPPPPPKKLAPIPGLNCPPPPTYIYITGPPGNLYPVDPYSQSSGYGQLWFSPAIMVVVGVLGLLASL